MSEIEELLKNEQYEDASLLARKNLSEDSSCASMWYFLFLSENRNYTEFDGENPNNAMALNKAIELADSNLKKKIEGELRLYKALSLIPGMCYFIRNAELGNTEKSLGQGKEALKTKCSITGLNAITDGISSLVKKAESREQVLCYHDFAEWMLNQSADIETHKLLMQIEGNPLYPKSLEAKKKEGPRFGGLFLLGPYVLMAFFSIFINYFTCCFIRFFKWIGAIFRHEGKKAFLKYCEILFGGLIYIIVCLFYEFYIVIYCLVSVIRRTMNPWKGFGMIFSTVFHMFYGTKR